MKKISKIMIITLLAILIIFIAAFFIVKSIKIPEIVVEEIDLEDIADGIYSGEYSAGPVKVSLKVEVKNNRIKDIIIEEHRNGLGKKGEKIIDEIISKQSLNVDVVSGATLSSNVIKKAVEKALK